MEKTGRVVDRSVFAEKTISAYHSSEEDFKIEILVVERKNGEQSIRITMDKFPMMKLYGTVPDRNEIIHINSLEYLGGNTHGWNEFTLELLGEGSLSFVKTAVFMLKGKIEPAQITFGRIQRYDTRITSSEAVTALRNRRERVSTLVEWMRLIENSKAAETDNMENFEKYWKPILFPETVSKKKRPANWLQDNDQFKKAEDIRWNTSYTERVFPDELVYVRNSGTLLRDWEEALAWIYMEYKWDNIIELLSNKIILEKK
ncbi:MAG: hypothetical protein LBC76_12210 [Treponema sp.]|jgi:hypothetical protein|nr:hypothetical protein [Treponema sp.]